MDLKPLLNQIPPEDRKRVLKAFEERYSNDKPGCTETRVSDEAQQSMGDWVDPLDEPQASE